ncbi:SAM-dependent methyltransferase [Actinoplanes flavus]
MSRTELADLVNQKLRELNPGVNITQFYVDLRWIGKLERGEHTWPSEPRRVALCRALQVDDEAEIGLYIARGDHPIDNGHHARASEQVDMTTAHPARRYNYWLGGNDHFGPDRESGDRIAEAFPTVRTAALENRAFLGRAVSYLTERCGIRQFLDLGAGLPAPGNTHEVAQSIAPAARVLYVDNDPMVGTHSRALLLGDPEGHTGYIEADVRYPQAILTAPEVAAALDLSQPVAILLVAVLHFIHDDQEAVDIVRQFCAAVPSGSYLVVSNATMDFNTPEELAVYEAMFAAGHTDARSRTREQFQQFFTGCELVDPNIVAVTEWKPEVQERPAPSEVAIYGAVGRVL